MSVSLNINLKPVRVLLPTVCQSAHHLLRLRSGGVVGVVVVAASV